MENTKKARYTSQKSPLYIPKSLLYIPKSLLYIPKSLLYICYTWLPSLLLVARIRYTLRHRCDTLAIHCYTWQCPPPPTTKTKIGKTNEKTKKGKGWGVRKKRMRKKTGQKNLIMPFPCWENRRKKLLKKGVFKGPYKAP